MRTFAFAFTFFSCVFVNIKILAGTGRHLGKILIADTTAITHTTDGMLDDWPAGSFTPDKESGIAYAIDNDANNLYLALKVSTRTEQFKLSRMGMKVFIDLKGKKKESRGIEFPVKGENGGFRMENTGGSQNDQQGNRQDEARMKAMFRLSAVTLKLFGFDNQPDEQGLMRDGSANIAFNWDSTNALGIEYVIPLSLFHEDLKDLNQQIISIGWKINGLDLSSFSGSGTENNFGGTGGRERGSGSFRGNGSGFRGGRTENSSGNNQQSNRDQFTKEQEFWAKYTLNLPKL